MSAMADAPSPPEAPLDPDLPIVDALHHLWHKDGRRYLFRDYLADIAAAGHNIVASIAVSGGSMYRADGPPELRSTGETEFYAGAAAMSASGLYGDASIAAAIVSHGDLHWGDRLAATLDAHERAAGGRLRGVRVSAAWTPAPTPGISDTAPEHLLLSQAARDAARLLAQRGLNLEIRLSHLQLADLADLARASPQTAIVVDHCGMPLGVGPFAGRQQEVFAAWRAGIALLAACPNVAVRLGGLRRSGAVLPPPDPAPSDSERPRSRDIADAWRPYIETCIAVFTPQRCMFESNFPPDRSFCGYGALWNAFKRIAGGYSTDEKTALFSATAQRLYRLPATS